MDKEKPAVERGPGEDGAEFNAPQASGASPARAKVIELRFPQPRAYCVDCRVQFYQLSPRHLRCEACWREAAVLLRRARKALEGTT